MFGIDFGSVKRRPSQSGRLGIRRGAFHAGLDCICLETLESGAVTKDLAPLITPDQTWMATNPLPTGSMRRFKRLWGDALS